MKTITKFFILSLALVFLAVPVLAQNIGSLQTVVTPGFSFNLDLYPGYTDQDVLELQRVLNADVDTIVSYQGDGSRGHETRYFGEQTKQAVIKFQEKYADAILTPQGLTKGNGVVGKLTRTKLNLLIGVINTYESKGSPESGSKNNSSTNTPTPVIVSSPVFNTNTNLMADSSVCGFINLLVSINVIQASLQNQALNIFGCLNTINNNQNYTDTSYHRPYVKIEANGDSGSTHINSGDSVTITWTSDNVDDCYDPVSGNSKSLSGSKKISGITENSTIGLTCRGDYGSASSYVYVYVDGASSGTGGSLSASCSTDSTALGGYTNWKVTAAGGYGANTYVYNYSWLDNNGLATSSTSTSPYLSLKYSTTGTKNLTVQVKSADYSKTASCSAQVTAANSNQTSITTTNSNKVLDLSGNSGEMVSVKQTSTLNVTNKLTLEAWVKPTQWSENIDATTMTADNVIISKGDLGKETLEYALTLDNGKLVYHNKNSAIWSCDNLVPLDEWTHVAVSVDESGKQTNLYVNGALVTNVCQGEHGLFGQSSVFNKSQAITESTVTASSSSATSSSAYAANTSPRNIHIGNYYAADCSAEAVQNGFIGNLDDVRIWNLARNASDIKNYATSSVATTSGLIAEYTFDDYSAKDSSKYGNNGFQKGGAFIIEDKTSPAYYSPTTDLIFSSSFTYSPSAFLNDPDGACYSEPTTEEEMGMDEGAAYTMPIAGIVTAVGECTPRNSFDGKLWQVAISPCSAGDPVSGASSDGFSAAASNEPGYIVIREGMQPVPKVGMVVKGVAVPDHGQMCKNEISGRWIGTITGHLASASSKGCDANMVQDAQKTAEEQGKLLGEVNPLEWAFPPIAITHEVVNQVGSVIGKVFGW